MTELAFLIDQARLDAVRSNPQRMHWSQSPFEKVTNATALLDGRHFVLTRTDFFAPKMVKHSSFRTEDAGETYRLVLQRARSKWGDFEKWRADSGRWFLMDLNENYEKGDFPHIDYTLWVYNPRVKAFVNLRAYPIGSYLLDKIDTSFFMDGGAEKSPIEGTNSSYGGPWEDNDPLPPEKRTYTLDQLARQNRLRECTIIIQTPDGDFKGKAPDGTVPPEFSLDGSWEKIYSFELEKEAPGLMGRLKCGDVIEQVLQGVLQRFKYHLEQCKISYRK